MKQKKRLYMLLGGLVLALALLAIPLFSALALDTMPPPLDPQSWRFARDMTWDDWHDNTAFNWKIDGDKIIPRETKHGLLVLYDFADRPFIVSSPTGSEQLGNPQIGNVPRNELLEFWESFLNDPEDHYNDGLNRGITISEFWKENTQGRWKVELDSCGVYRVPGYEFEYGMSGADLPTGFTARSNVNTLAINLAIADGIDLRQYDFAFVLHAGCAESQVWEEAGYMMFYDQKSIDDFYSAKYRFEQIEANPEITTPVPQAAWNWLNQHDPQNGGDGRGWWASTRYVPWTSWWAHIAIWSSTSNINVSGIGTFRLSQQGETNGCATFSHEFGHIVSIGDNYGTNLNQRVYSGFWDLMAGGSMTGFGGNHTRYEVPNLHGGSIPAHMLSRTKRKLGFIDTDQLCNVNYPALRSGTPVVTEVFARTTPIGDQFAAIYPDSLGVINEKVKAGKAAIGLRLYGFTDAKPSTPAAANWETDNWSGSAGRYDNYSLEVVQQVGYDSAQSDSGVLIAKNRETLSESAPYTWQVDAHPGGLDTIDFWTPIGPKGEPSVPQPFRNNDNNHLSACLFHVGKSVTPNDYGVECKRTGQTNETYNVVVNPDGSVNKKSIADNTVNEYIDTYNNLQFYILDKMYTPGPYGGDILSYQVGVRHLSGAAVNGELKVDVAKVEPEAPRKVAVASFSITNTGDATDIIRVKAEGYLTPVLLNDLYALAAGETKTVSCYVELPADIRARDLSGKAITFSASSETNSAKVGAVSIPVSDLIAFSYTVLLQPANTAVRIGNTLLVDVLLVGDVNYTQLATEIAYDTGLLEYAGYADLQGWAAAVTKVNPNKIAVRSVPGMNMVVGAPCPTDGKIVTLKFTVKDSFTEKSVDTALSFASILVSPPGGVTGTGVTPGKPVTITLKERWVKDTPEDSIEKIKAINPDFLKNGETNPTFIYSSTNSPTTNANTIFEEVWVEVPCDTDEDGKRDLVRIEICRPAESGVIIDPLTGETKVSVGVLMEHSPYRNPSTHRQIPLYNVWLDQKVNPSTAHYTYDDVKSPKPRSADWYWGTEAMYWNYATKQWEPDLGGNPSWYVTPRAGSAITDKAWFIPEAQKATKVVYQGNWPGVAPSLSTGRTTPSAFNQYYYTRGYATVTSSSLGNNFNEAVATAMLQNTGYNSTSTVEEILSAAAVINWLSGDGGVKAYTDRNATTEVVATWCNGTVAMTGTSYLGTMSMGTATSGVKGLKAIMPVAGESVKYNYYRAGGAVSAPGDGWQGEECDYLAVRCFYSQDQAAQFAQKYPIYQAYLEQMGSTLGRDTGDYNTFYDDRNFLTTIDSVRDDCGIMIMHGFNDWNVKTVHADQLYQAAKVAGKTVKEVWGLWTHASDWNKVESHYMEYFHLWMDRFLFGLDNDAENRIPEVNLPSNNNLNWQSYDSWPIAGTTHQKWFLNSPSAGKAGTFTVAAPAAGTAGSFKDDRAANAHVTTTYTAPPTTTDYNRSGIINAQVAVWENRLFNPAIVDELSTERLVFVKELEEPLHINGTVKVGLELASDTPWGNISVSLIELGPNYRATGTATGDTLISGNGTSNISRNNYTSAATLSQYKIVTRGFADLQNPNPNQSETYLNAKKEHGFIPDFYFQTHTITPGTNYKYYFTMMPVDYTFKAGTKLAIYVYTADYRHTQVPKTIAPELTLRTGASTFVELPIVPTYSIFYKANGGTGLYDVLGGYADSYPKAGQSAKAWEQGYRVVGGVGNTTVVKLNAFAPWTFGGWNTKADGSGTAYQPGNRIADADMGDFTLFAQWYGTVTLNADGGALPAGVTSSFRISPTTALSALPQPTKAGFVFTGWAFEEVQVTGADLASGNVVGKTLVANYAAEPAPEMELTPDAPVFEVEDTVVVVEENEEDVEDAAVIIK